MRWALQMERLGETVAIVLLQLYYRFHIKALSPELQTTMKEHFDECGIRQCRVTRIGQDILCLFFL